MTERMNQLYDLTKNLFFLLDKSVSKNLTEREQTIQKVTESLEKREILLSQIKPPYTDEEKRVGAELIPLEQKIQQRLTLLFNNLKSDMKNVKKQKSSNQKYINPYQSLAHFDGSYLDKKK
ncbi:hypothetical protein Pryu01_00677 [Paraliobacillus ryukyuensis]|uniref:Flagellar protein FliT n=1 Tax=Paraliobacillus ryukyuensis TaxID=200904 RepID=A0A366EH38_9BACI|nr:flagellar protein FliT [Paraliobacillus ryukyuensis]RBP00749.1 flagellar protein FliT [Paraliobacillus ryukyuensis]